MVDVASHKWPPVPGEFEDLIARFVNGAREVSIAIGDGRFALLRLSEINVTELEHPDNE